MFVGCLHDYGCRQNIPAAQEYQRPPVPKFLFIDCAKCTVKTHRACGLPITQTSAPATPEAGRWVGSAPSLIVVGGFWCGCRQVIPAAQEYQRPPVPKFRFIDCAKCTVKTTEHVACPFRKLRHPPRPKPAAGLGLCLHMNFIEVIFK